MDHHWQDTDQDDDLEEDYDQTLDIFDWADDADERPRAGKHCLGLSRHYVPSWTSKDAFREMYQNWRDAILETFQLNLESFTPVVKETTQHIQITIHTKRASTNANDNGKLLGYILYDKKKHTVEITNLKAALKWKHLNLGASDKRKHDKFAGTHGEGFKLAALVLSREGHSVRLTSTSFYWNFRLLGDNRSTLFCRLSAIKADPLQKRKERFAAQVSVPSFRRGLTANAWEDVTFLISKPKNTHGTGIGEGEFRSWLEVALELSPPSHVADVVRTYAGDLILDQHFKASIYLKGLKIAGHELTYMYGYNFAHGTINRDRDRLSSLEEEEVAMSKIWGYSILAGGDRIADLYIELLQKHKNCAETKRTSEKIARKAAKHVWQRLRQNDPDAFFYFSDDNHSQHFASDQTLIIKEDLKQQPHKLSEASWRLFTKFSLIRTPREEQVHRFQASQAITMPLDSFQSSIFRALKACLALEASLESLKVCFVEGGGTSLNLMFDPDASEIRINKQWLDFDHVHKENACDALRLPPGADVDRSAFFCDHVVEDLLDEVLEELRRVSDKSPPSHKTYRGCARTCLRSMPCSVRATTTQAAGTVQVTWIGNESGVVSARHSDHVHYHVVLHQESTCKDLCQQLVYRGTTSTQSDSDSPLSPPYDLPPTIQCGCASQVVSRTHSMALFENLDHHESYFPMVARAEAVSFFGAPPTSISPNRPAIDDTLLTPPVETTTSPIADNRRRSRKGKPKARMWSRKKRTASVVSDIISDDEEVGAPAFLPAGFEESISPTTVEMPVVSTPQIDSAKQDEAQWYAWIQNELPFELGKLNAGYGHKVLPQNLRSCSKLEVRSLRFTFERGEYTRVRLGVVDLSEHPIFVHEIFSEEFDHDLSTIYLLITKYSLLRSTMPFNQLPTVSDSTSVNTSREVLLHFECFDKMGLRDDAEIIRLDEVTRAGPLTSGTEIDGEDICYLNVDPEDLGSSTMFCRFAIRRTQYETERCLTPINSHLLKRKDRWNIVEYPSATKPVVYDFSPEILGPSEGLSQAYCDIDCAFGFDSLRDLSWKVRHVASQVYDGTPKDILKSISEGHLCPPASSEQSVPRIAVIAGTTAPFRLNNMNDSLPSLNQFTKILENVVTVVESKLDPTFVVLLTSPTMLHPRASGSFVKSLFTLLEHRFSVHMKLCSLQDLGLPFQRDILVTVASRYCCTFPWSMFWPSVTRDHSITIETLMQDLTIANPRVVADSKPALVCVGPSPEVTDGEQSVQRMIHIYNHGTGQHNGAATPLYWNTEKLEALTVIPKLWYHPARHDLLTVRELARIQGFTDDFIFYEPNDLQYKLIWTAIPPDVTRFIGNAIHYVLRSHQAVRVGTSIGNARGQKRVRLDDEE